MIRFLRHCAAASAAEFALILPAALLLMFGVIDVGRYVWQMNQYEKAVQMGARYAAATQVVPTPLNTANYSNVTCPGQSATLKPGDTICVEAMKALVCNSTKQICECVGSGSVCSAASGTSFNATAFQNIVNRMAVASKRFEAANVTVEYAPSGIGYYGDPSRTSSCVPSKGSKNEDVYGPECQLPDVAPIVTVKLTGMNYYPITLGPLEYGIPYPPFSYSLTMEDGDGTVAS